MKNYQFIIILLAIGIHPLIKFSSETLLIVLGLNNTILNYTFLTWAAILTSISFFLGKKSNIFKWIKILLFTISIIASISYSLLLYFSANFPEYQLEKRCNGYHVVSKRVFASEGRFYFFTKGDSVDSSFSKYVLESSGRYNQFREKMCNIESWSLDTVYD